MERRGFLAGGAAGTAALAAPSIAAAQPQVQWRCAGSFPKSTDVLWGVLELLSRRVAELTGNAFQIRIFTPGEIVPALQVLDAVGGGTVECGHTAAYYYIGKDPSLGFGTEMPFGMNARQHLAWIHAGGGREIMEEVYRDQGVVALPANNTGAQMGGWFRKEIRSSEDLNRAGQRDLEGERPRGELADAGGRHYGTGTGRLGGVQVAGKTGTAELGPTRRRRSRRRPARSRRTRSRSSTPGSSPSPRRRSRSWRSR